MAVGIMGGTFDPVHYGHLITAQSLLEIRNLGKIIFIPCFISPHKTETISSSAKHRINILKLALQDKARFEYSDYEIRKEGISYTIDTLRELKKYYAELELIIGFDNALKFTSWKEPEEILSLCKVVVLKRESRNQMSEVRNWRQEVIPQSVKEDNKKYFDRFTFIDTPIIEISATQIRSRVKEGLSIDYLVPDSVKKYIIENNLYK